MPQFLPPDPTSRRFRRLQRVRRQRLTRKAVLGVVAGAAIAGTVISASASDVNPWWQERRALDTPVPAISVAPAEVQVKTLTETRQIPFETHTTTDPMVRKGTEKVVRNGVPGAATINYQVTYIDGVEVEREEGLFIMHEEPTHQVIAVGSLVIPPATDVQKGTNRDLGQQLAAEIYGWSGEEWQCLDALWRRESGWSHTAENRSSGAYGIPQALPGKKMATFGSDWMTNPATQIQWGLSYISGRYGTPCGAWGHFTMKNWY